MAFPYRKVLVTGGAGFIGSHLVDALRARGCRVSVLDDLSTGSLENLRLDDGGTEFVHGDVADGEAVREACGDCEAVLHLAAMVSVPRTMADPIAAARVNTLGTVTVLEEARRLNVGSVVLASSCAVYGDNPHLPLSENAPPAPRSPYAVQKLGGEDYLRMAHRVYGTDAVSLRFFNVYGPRQNPSSPYSGVISIFMTRALADRPPTIYGDGDQTRDFVYVADVVRAIMLAATTPAAAGAVVNVGSGRSVAIGELWRQISTLAGAHAVPRHEPARDGDIRHSRADAGLAETLLGFAAEFNLETGLARTLEWYRRAAVPSRAAP